MPTTCAVGGREALVAATGFAVAAAVATDFVVATRLTTACAVVGLVGPKVCATGVGSLPPAASGTVGC